MLGLTPNTEISVNFGSRSYMFKDLIAFANYLHVPPPDQVNETSASGKDFKVYFSYLLFVLLWAWFY
jgi:hypothetical protein